MNITTIDLETPLITRGEGAAPRPIIVSVHRDHEHYIARVDDVDWSFLDTDIINGANIAYDMSCLIRHRPELRARILRAYAEHRVVDCQLAHVLVCISEGVPSGSYSLDTLTRSYLGLALDKDTWRLRYLELEHIPLWLWPWGAIEYALVDTWAARKVLDAVVARDELGALGVLGHLTYAAWGLHEAEVEGVYTHEVRAHKLAFRANQRITAVVDSLKESGLLRPDGTKDTKAAQALMLSVWPDAPRTPGGGVSITKDTTPQAEAIDPVRGRVLAEYTEFTQAGKMRTAANNLVLGISLPLQTRFNACMETYRTSSSMPEGGALVGVQMQNPWRLGGYREVFTPEPGELFIGADYSMAEVYSLAQFCKHKFGFSKLGEALASGKDVHLLTATLILGCTYEEILAHPKKKFFRQLAKALVFGIPGGLGAAKMVIYCAGYGVTLTEQEAGRYKMLFLRAYPDVAMYLEWVSRQGYPWTLVHPITGFIRGHVGYTDGANTGFQSLTAWYAKTAVSRVAAARWDETSPLHGWKIWNMIHDEILMRGPASTAANAARELSRIMVEAASEVLPDYKIAADPWVGNVWSKHIPDAMDVEKPWLYEDFIQKLRESNDTKTLKDLGEL